MKKCYLNIFINYKNMHMHKITGYLCLNNDLK